VQCHQRHEVGAFANISSKIAKDGASRALRCLDLNRQKPTARRPDPKIVFVAVYMRDLDAFALKNICRQKLARLADPMGGASSVEG
jgi:hypothetical protein